MAEATNTLFRQIGVALSLAVAGTVFTAQLLSGESKATSIHPGRIVISAALLFEAALGVIVLFVRVPRANVLR